MKYFICLLLSILTWCLVLGHPYSHLLSSPDFGGIIIVTNALLVVVLQYFDKKKTTLSTILTIIVIAAYIVVLCLVMFSTTVREAFLQNIGMQQYIADFNEAEIPLWKYLTASLLEFTIIALCGITHNRASELEKL